MGLGPRVGNSPKSESAKQPPPITNSLSPPPPPAPLYAQRKCAVCALSFLAEDKSPQNYCNRKACGQNKSVPSVSSPAGQGPEPAAAPGSSCKTLLAAPDRPPRQESEDSVNLTGTFRFNTSDRPPGGCVDKKTDFTAKFSQESSTSDETGQELEENKPVLHPKRYVTVPVELLDDEKAVDLLRDSLKVQNSVVENAFCSRGANCKGRAKSKNNDNKPYRIIIKEPGDDGLEHTIVDSKNFHLKRDTRDNSPEGNGRRKSVSQSHKKVHTWTKPRANLRDIQEGFRQETSLPAVMNPIWDFNSVARRDLDNAVVAEEKRRRSRQRYQSARSESKKRTQKRRSKSFHSPRDNITVEQKLKPSHAILLGEIKKLLDETFQTTALVLKKSRPKVTKRSPETKSATQKNLASNVYDSEAEEVDDDRPRAPFMVKPLNIDKVKKVVEENEKKLGSGKGSSKSSPSHASYINSEENQKSFKSASKSPPIQRKLSEKQVFGPEAEITSPLNQHSQQYSSACPMENTTQFLATSPQSNDPHMGNILDIAKDPEATSQLIEQEEVLPVDVQTTDGNLSPIIADTAEDQLKVQPVPRVSKSANDIDVVVQRARDLGFHSSVSSGDESRVLTADMIRAAAEKFGMSHAMFVGADHQAAGAVDLITEVNQQKDFNQPFKGLKDVDKPSARISSASSVERSNSENWKATLRGLPEPPKVLELAVLKPVGEEAKTWLTDISLKPGDNIYLRGVFDEKRDDPESQNYCSFSIDLWRIQWSDSLNNLSSSSKSENSQASSPAGTSKSNKVNRDVERIFFLNPIFQEREMRVGISDGNESEFSKTVAKGEDFVFQEGTKFEFVFHFRDEDFVLKWAGALGTGEMIVAYECPLSEINHIRIFGCSQLDTALIFY